MGNGEWGMGNGELGRHPSVSKDNGKRLDWFSVLLGAASGVAQQPNPGVAISAAVAAGIWRCLIGILEIRKLKMGN